MMLNKRFVFSKKGSSLLFTTMLSLVVTIGIIIVACYLSSFRPKPVLPVSTMISADYHMESAVIMQTQKLKNNPNEKFKTFEKEIYPGITMSMTGNKSDTNMWIYELRVWGRGLDRNIKVSGHNEIPDRLTFY